MDTKLIKKRGSCIEYFALIGTDVIGLTNNIIKEFNKYMFNLLILELYIYLIFELDFLIVLYCETTSGVCLIQRTQT